MPPTGRCSSARDRRRSTAPTATRPSSSRSSDPCPCLAPACPVGPRLGSDRPVSRLVTSVESPRAWVLAPTQFFALAATNLFGLWLILGTGAAVRLTDSGLGCRHWPGCERGHPLPAKDYHAYVEFGNRMVGGVVIVVTLLTWIGAWRTPALPRWAVRLPLGLFLGTLAQAPLGYLAVKTDLRWPVVMAHLLLSMVLIAGAVLLVFAAAEQVGGRTEPLVPLELRRLGVVIVALALGLLVSGTFATAAGPHSGGGTEHVARFARLQPVVFVHAATVALFGCSFLF